MADVLYAADLHGSRALYEEAVSLASELKARAVILGGDLAPHGTVPEQRAFFLDYLVPLLREYREEGASADLFYIMGNDDWSANIRVLLESGIERFHYIHGAVRPLLDDLWVTGLASVSVTPFALKDWERWEEGTKPPAR